MDRFDEHTVTTGTETKTYTGLMHAGAGTGLALGQLSVIIPGLLPSLALLGVFTAAIVLPILALGVLAAILAAPPYALWRLATRGRRRRRRIEAGARASRSVARFGPIDPSAGPATASIRAD